MNTELNADLLEKARRISKTAGIEIQEALEIVGNFSIIRNSFGKIPDTQKKER